MILPPSRNSKRGLRWITSVISLLPLLSNASSLNGAFCSSNFTGIANFPLPVPSTDLSPWVWDAIESTELNTVEITIVSRRACWFNHSQWQRANKELPQHSKHFGYGLSSNILVNSEKPPDLLADPYLRDREGLFKETLNCLYYRNGRLLPIAQTISQPVNGDVAWLQYGTVHIICPSPGVKFDLMRIERVTIKSINGASMIPLESSRKEDLIVSTSDSFPVCHAAELVKDIVNTNMDNKGRYYGVSVCTATGRINRSHIVEWIEYHKYLGVDHFFIYLTSSTTQHSMDYAALSDYVIEGTVTIVPWGYQNCVKGMASGRWCHWKLQRPKVQYFWPPKAIAQSAALASCYSRFRRFTKYMIHIDDDEFVTMNSSIARSIKKKRPGRRLKFKGALYEYANLMFLSNPHAAAISFRPVGKHYCPSAEYVGKKGIANHDSNSHKSVLPRIGVNLVSTLMVPFESKLLMRTDAVRMFFIHYLTQLEFPYKSYDPVVADVNEAALLHFKVAPIVSGNIWGLQYIERNWTAESIECRFFRNFGGYKEDLENGYYHPSGNESLRKYFIQNVGVNLQNILEVKYLSRMSADKV